MPTQSNSPTIVLDPASVPEGANCAVVRVKHEEGPTCWNYDMPPTPYEKRLRLCDVEPGLSALVRSIFIYAHFVLALCVSLNNMTMYNSLRKHGNGATCRNYEMPPAPYEKMIRIYDVESLLSHTCSAHFVIALWRFIYQHGYI